MKDYPNYKKSIESRMFKGKWAMVAPYSDSDSSNDDNENAEITNLHLMKSEPFDISSNKIERPKESKKSKRGAILVKSLSYHSPNRYNFDFIVFRKKILLNFLFTR